LRTLHQLDASQTPPTHVANVDLKRRLLWVRQLATRLQTGKGHSLRIPATARPFWKRIRPGILRDLNRAIETLTHVHSSLANCLVHGDVTVANVLMTDTKAQLIDWELLRSGYAMEELARSAMNVCNLSIPVVESLLDGYGATHWSQEERLAFAAFLRIPSEIVYLLRVRRRSAQQTDVDVAQWALLRRTWRQRQALVQQFLG